MDQQSSQDPTTDLISCSIGDQHRGGPATVGMPNVRGSVTANPFEEPERRINEYTAQEIATLQARLDKKLGPEYISSRPGAAGQKVHYLSADKCINLANEVFGFNGWSSSIQKIDIDFVCCVALSCIITGLICIIQIEENQNTGKINLGLSVIVRVTLKDGTFHEVSSLLILVPLMKRALKHLGYRLWPYRELQGQSCSLRKGQERGDN